MALVADVAGQQQTAPAGLLDPGLRVLGVFLLGVEIGDRDVRALAGIGRAVAIGAA